MKTFKLKTLSIVLIAFLFCACERDESPVEDEYSKNYISNADMKALSIHYDLKDYETIIVDDTKIDITQNISKEQYATINNAFKNFQEVIYIPLDKVVVLLKISTSEDTQEVVLENIYKKLDIQSNPTIASTDNTTERAVHAKNYFTLTFYDDIFFKGQKLVYHWGSRANPVLTNNVMPWRVVSQRPSVPNWFNDKASSFTLQVVSTKSFEGGLELFANANYKKRINKLKSFKNGPLRDGWYYGGLSYNDILGFGNGSPFSVNPNNNVNGWRVWVKH